MGSCEKRGRKSFLLYFAEVQGEKKAIVSDKEINQACSITFHTGISGLVAQIGGSSSKPGKSEWGITQKPVGLLC